MQNLRIYDEQVHAISDMIAYYEMCDYGCGEERPLSEEQEEHVRLIKDFQRDITALEAIHRT